MTTVINGTPLRLSTVDVDYHVQRGLTARIVDPDSDVFTVVQTAVMLGPRLTVQDPRVCGLFDVVTCEPGEIVLRLWRQVP